MSDTPEQRTDQLHESVRVAKDIGERGGAPLGRTVDAAMTKATTVPTDRALRVFHRLLDAHGLRYALYSLLRLTDYRFITVFRLEDGMIASVAHVDRENLAILGTEVVEESASYCCYVRDSDGPFVIVDSLVDPRADEHVKQKELRAYCGVPITDADGTLLGTLCHYDQVPRDPAQLNAELLIEVAGEIARRRLLDTNRSVDGGGR